MKSVLPPMAVDTPDELAALSQFLVNVIDFRDPDCTMTHFRNPDVKVVLGSIGTTAPFYNPTYLAPIGATIPAASTAIPLDQYGMEYNPIAINEALAYSFQTGITPPKANRFFVELVNTLSQTAIGVVNANGGTINAPEVSTLDLSLANYDMVIAADDPVSRPDPFTGQLLPIQSAHYYGQMPFNQGAGSATPLLNPAADVQLTPLYALGAPSNPPADNPPGTDFPLGYFYVIGNPYVSGTENAPLTPTVTLSQTYDPVTATPPNPPPTPTSPPPGYAPHLQPVAPPPPVPDPGQPNTLPQPVPQIAPNTMLYYWICLRRPANPFGPPQPDISQPNYNPMIVVDALRFPYIEGGVTASGNGTNAIFSSQRYQPFRGGHAVRLPGDTSSTAAPLYTPYGYSEQMAAPVKQTGEQGIYAGTTPYTTTQIYDTLTLSNDNAEPWDYFPFNDRDFTSVAELMLVPGCPPGLFTKQFVELAPMPPATAPTGSPLTQFPVSIPPANPTANPPAGLATSTAVPTLALGNAGAAFPAAAKGTVVQPHSYPYLVDKFFYSGYGGAGSATTPPPDPGNVVDGYGADGWFKMFEFFEVPSQSLGAIGAVAQGTNFDWARQDMKPGLLNLNLIIDEEAFFSVLGSQSITLSNGVAGTNTDSFSQNLLNFAQLPAALPTDIPYVVTSSLASGAAGTSYPYWNLGVSQPGVVANDPVSHPGPPVGAFNGMKAAFAQFLSLRHGANLSPTGTPLLFSALPERPFHSLSYPDINYTVMHRPTCHRPRRASRRRVLTRPIPTPRTPACGIRTSIPGDRPAAS